MGICSQKRFTAIEWLLVAIAALGTLAGGAYCWFSGLFVIDHNLPLMLEMPPHDRDGIVMAAQVASFLSFAPAAGALIALTILVLLRGRDSR